MDACMKTCAATLGEWQWILVVVITLPWMGLMYNGLMYGLSRVGQHISKKYRFPYDGK